MLAATGFAPKLQATRRDGLFRIELPPLVSDPNFGTKPQQPSITKTWEEHADDTYVPRLYGEVSNATSHRISILMATLDHFEKDMRSLSQQKAVGAR